MLPACSFRVVWRDLLTSLLTLFLSSMTMKPSSSVTELPPQPSADEHGGVSGRNTSSITNKSDCGQFHLAEAREVRVVLFVAVKSESVSVSLAVALSVPLLNTSVQLLVDGQGKLSFCSRADSISFLFWYFDIFSIFFSILLSINILRSVL